MDGTDASNLNCGSVGCGPWGPGSPTNSTDSCACIYPAGLKTNLPVDGSFVASYVCEIEVCGPGRYLGPSFATGCLQCPPGSYSVGGAVGWCTLCPPGTFGSSSGLTSPVCSGNCSAGYACPTGSTNSIAAVCPVGRYSQSGWGSCNLCAAGSFGGTEGLTSPACSGNCSAGYACPAGSTNATAVMCSAGQYSLSGAGSCALCPASAPFSSPGSASCYSACPDATWIAWLDAAGVEGAHSCLKRVTATATWSGSNATCVALEVGSHLLTSRQVVVDLRVSLPLVWCLCLRVHNVVTMLCASFQR